MIDVCCALIKGHNGDILVTQRSSAMRLPLKWEFPGGKLEPGESEEECLIREIAEELGVVIRVLKRLISHLHDDGTSVIRLIPFTCEIIAGEICLTEHASFVWLAADQLHNLDWAEADLPILNDYLKEQQ